LKGHHLYYPDRVEPETLHSTLEKSLKRFFSKIFYDFSCFFFFFGQTKTQFTNVSQLQMEGVNLVVTKEREMYSISYVKPQWSCIHYVVFNRPHDFQ